MAAQAEGSAQISLVGGVVETVVDESTGGAILTSDNTRLTADKGTLAPRPKWLTHGNPASPAPHCYGVVPGCSDSTLAIFNAGHGSRRVVPSLYTEQLLRPANATHSAPNYIAAHVTNAGGVNTTRAGGPPSVCIDGDGNSWFAWRSEGDPGQVRVCLEVRGEDGSLLAPRATAAAYDADADVASELPGWTALITTSIGVSLVYSTVTSEIWHAGFELGSGAIQATYAPVDISGIVSSLGDRERWRWDACASGGSGMFFVGASGTTTGVLRYIPLVPPFSGEAFTSLTSAWTLTAGDSRMATAVCTFVLGGARYVACATGGRGGAAVRAYVFTWDGAAFTAVSNATLDLSLTGEDGALAVAIQPQHDTVAPGVLVAYSACTPAGAEAPIVTTARWLKLSDASSTTEDRRYIAMKLAGRGGALRISDSETYALIPLAAQADRDEFAAFDVETPHPIIDPAVHLCIGNKASFPGEVSTVYVAGLTPIARLGLDGAYAAPSLSSTWMAVSGTRCLMGYALVDYQGGINAAVPRWANIDLQRAEQPSFARDSGGVSTVAAAHPAAWDGSELCDVTSLHAPVLVQGTLLNTGAGIETLAVGQYAVRAIFRFRDGSGQLRRSAPSLPFVFTADGIVVNASVSFADPLALRTSPWSSPPDCVVYITTPNGSIFYYSTTAQRDASNSFFTVPSLLSASNGADRLYSTGADNEPLLPLAPPALWDVVTAGPRQFGIDAEYRNRVWATKLKERGIALEWAGELTQEFGEQAGKLQKLVVTGGQVRVLAERGIWAITGDGPDNSGLVGAFGDPQLISTRGCRSRESVAAVPGVGVLFEGEDGVLTMLGGEGVKRFETIQPRRLGAPSVFLNQQEVAWPIKDSDGYLVYNYLQDAFTTWSGLGRQGHARCDLPIDGSVTTYAMTNDAVLISMDADTGDATCGMSVGRGWIAPNGPNGDIVARELWVRLALPTSGPMAGVTVRCEFDYGQGHVAIVRSWTAAELASTALLRGDRVTVAVNLHGTPCRSVRVTVNDVRPGTGSPMRPLGCELLYGQSAGNLRRVLPRAAIK